ncbi:pyruvate kinase [Candidatus Woesearchaeota archaeon CG_4_10_14_0_8_um_filter_47_5]|nr:MAG: pyruvate kinase [Candidatus Woesearchaeota archaeon CG_4_10_14_0_8_um_filter_47_5]
MDIKRTKIIATVGPASLSKKALTAMAGEGMNCARINTAHGDFAQYEAMIKLIRSIPTISTMPIILDIKGPEIRLKTRDDIPVKKGTHLSLGFSPKKEPYCSYDFFQEVEVPDTILFDGGLVQGTIIRKIPEKKQIVVEIHTPGILKNNKGINLPNKSLKIPSLSEKDRDAVRFALKHKLSYIALSFVRTKDDVINLKNLLGNYQGGIIAKIENKEGVDNIREIIAESEGVMIARGDLGAEIRQEKLPLIQKGIIHACNQAGKISIVATQMLESMIERPTPSRAEVSDVANAIIDGADAVMLSGETATGKYPLQAISVMSRIAREIEDTLAHNISMDFPGSVSEEMTKSAYTLALRGKATKIVCITRSGFTARLIARFRLPINILAVTDSHMTKKKLDLVWGVNPLVVHELPVQAIIPSVAYLLYKKGLLIPGDKAIFLGGVGTSEEQVVNLIEIHTVLDLLRYHGRI